MAGSRDAGLYLSGKWSKAGTGANQTVGTAPASGPALRINTIVVSGTAADTTVTISDGATQVLALSIAANAPLIIPWYGGFLTSIVVKALATTTVSFAWG